MIVVVAVVSVRFCVERANRKSNEPAKHIETHQIPTYIWYIYILCVTVLLMCFTFIRCDTHQFSFLHIKLASSFDAAFALALTTPKTEFQISCIFDGTKTRDYAYAAV